MFRLVGLLTLLGAGLVNCEKDNLQESITTKDQVQTRDVNPDFICANACPEGSILYDFNDLTPDQVFPADVNGVKVTAVTKKGDPAEVWVFDTDRTLEEAKRCDEFDDDDLLFPGGPYGNVAIIQRFGRTECANDAPNGGVINVDFTGVGGDVRINCMTFFDTEEPDQSDITVSGSVVLLDANESLIGDLIPIPAVNDGEAISLDIQTSDVAFMQILLLGSGAISDICLTLEDDPGCTYTQGRWKNKQAKDDAWCVPFDKKFDSWTDGDGWLEILKTPTKGNAWYILAHQYIAAYLNVTCLDADTDEIQETYNAAADFLNETRPDEKLSKDERADAIQWSEILDDFNNGLIGPGHCEKIEEKEELEED